MWNIVFKDGQGKENKIMTSLGLEIANFLANMTSFLSQNIIQILFPTMKLFFGAQSTSLSRIKIAASANVRNYILYQNGEKEKSGEGPILGISDVISDPCDVIK